MTVVPGSGGKDSFMTAHLLKYKYGMNPLTCTWAPHIYTDWGWKNHQAWIHAGFDNILFTPNGKVHRLITRLATDKHFIPFNHLYLVRKMFPQRLLQIQYKINILWRIRLNMAIRNQTIKVQKCLQNFILLLIRRDIFRRMLSE